MRRDVCFLLGGVMLLLEACSPVSGPDKSLAGAILGAGWGAGAGAVVGNQVDATGPGAAIGAGFGAGAGLMTGIGLDAAEGAQLEQQRELDALRVQVAANRRALETLQDDLDNRGRPLTPVQTSLQIFFDPERASIRSGSAAELERFAESVKLDPRVRSIQIHGHSEETGDTESDRQTYNRSADGGLSA